MTLYLRTLLVATLAAVCACAPPSQPQAPTTEAATTVIVPLPKVTALPCASIDETETLTIAFPEGSIYEKGAVFPGKEGLFCLNALSDWLKSSSQKNWQVSVGSEEKSGFDAQKLVQKRHELLARYFQRQGIDTSGWEWQQTIGEGLQLAFTNRP